VEPEPSTLFVIAHYKRPFASRPDGPALLGYSANPVSMRLRNRAVIEIPDDHRWDAPPKVEFATDSPVEEDGFEPSVPVRVFLSHAGGSPFSRRDGGRRCSDPSPPEIAMVTSKIRPERNFLDSSLFQ
jgi:hypothetical protein